MVTHLKFSEMVCNNLSILATLKLTSCKLDIDITASLSALVLKCYTTLPFTVTARTTTFVHKSAAMTENMFNPNEAQYSSMTRLMLRRQPQKKKNTA